MSNKSENAEIAVLQDQVGTIKSDLKEVGADVKIVIRQLDQLPQNFVTTVTFENYKKQVMREFATSRRRRWVENTLSAVAGAFLIAIAYWIIAQLVVGR